MVDAHRVEAPPTWRNCGDSINVLVVGVREVGSTKICAVHSTLQPFKNDAVFNFANLHKFA